MHLHLPRLLLFTSFRSPGPSCRAVSHALILATLIFATAGLRAAVPTQLQTLLPPRQQVFSEDCFLQAAAMLHRYSSIYEGERTRLTHVALSSGRQHSVLTFTHRNRIYGWDASCGVFATRLRVKDWDTPDYEKRIERAHTYALRGGRAARPRLRRLTTPDDVRATMSYLEEIARDVLAMTPCTFFIVSDGPRETWPVLVLIVDDQLGVYFPNIGTASIPISGVSREEISKKVARAAQHIRQIAMAQPLRDPAGPLFVRRIGANREPSSTREIKLAIAN